MLVIALAKQLWQHAMSSYEQFVTKRLNARYELSSATKKSTADGEMGHNNDRKIKVNHFHRALLTICR
jgi:hypothetical protein